MNSHKAANIAPAQKCRPSALETVRQWQPIATAPMGKPVLLFLNPPLETNIAVGWMPDRELNIVVGWGEVMRYYDGDEAHFTCGVCEEGSADTEGYSTPFLLRVSATHWQPLPEPPTF